MEDKSMIIIGAGIAGLSTGVYAQMNGYRSKILEMHTQAGGLVTAWKRRGYTIDGCIHWLVGSSPANGIHRFWEEIGLIQGRQIVDHEIFQVMEGADGRVFNIYSDVDRLEKHMLELSPQDAEATREFTGGIRFFLGMDPPMGDQKGLAAWLGNVAFMLRMMTQMNTFKKWMKTTCGDYGKRFKDPLLRESFSDMWYPDFSVFFLLATLAWLHKKTAGYPIGGSLPMIHNVEKRYLDLGGEIQYSARVEEILVENGRAVGVRLTDGSEQRAAWVISAADGHATIFDMLEGKYVDDTIRGYYQNYKPFPPILLAGIGVKRSFEDEPKSVAGITFKLKEPVVIADRPRKYLTAHLYNYDPTLAPEGKTVMTLIIETDYEYWKKLCDEGGSYDAKKSEISETLIDCLEQRWPGISADVEMIDVATPLTFERYTGNWRASFEGWMMTPENAMAQMKKTLPGLDNFYMVGHWVAPGGGLPSGVMTGRDVISRICKQDHLKFQTSKA